MAHSSFVRGALAAAVLVACAPSERGVDFLSADSLSAPPQGHPHFLRKPNAPPSSFAPASTSAQLIYYGGPVLSNVKAYAVYWGNSVRSTTTQQIPDFLSAMTNSTYMDWLNEYNTNISGQGGSPGTNQRIGRGAFAGTFTITPSIAASSSIDNAQIVTELGNQIAAGSLPPPDDNSLYITFFPPNVTITHGSSASCAQFCGYHFTFTQGNQNVYYAVIPDETCSNGQGCISNDNFTGVTIATSHEVIEAITDGAIGLASGSSLGPPMGWYDPNNGEIGDICANQAQTAPVQGQLGTYTAQVEWSNVASSCIGTRTATNDFSVAASPVSTHVAIGGSTTFQVLTQVTQGSPATVSVSLSGLPSGVTATVSPQSVSPGQAATVTLTASGSAAAVNNAVVAVVGVSGGVTHTASTLLTVAQPSGSDFSLSVSPNQIQLSPGGSATVNVSTQVAAGTPGAISLSVFGLPSGVTGTFQSSSVSAGQGTTLTLTASTSATASTASLSVVGQSGSLSHAGSVNLSVVSGPTVSWVNPQAGATISGSQTLQVQAPTVSSNATIAVTIDGTAFGSAPGTSFSQSWDTTQASEGTHQLKATVTDGTQTGSSSITVTVHNASGGIKVAMTAPSDGGTLSGTAAKLTATATLTGGDTLSSIEIWLDGVSLASGAGSNNSFTTTIDATSLVDGTHKVFAYASDGNGVQVQSTEVSFKINNTGTKPQPPTSANCASSSTGQSWGFTAKCGVPGPSTPATGCAAVDGPGVFCLLILGAALFMQRRRRTQEL